MEDDVFKRKCKGDASEIAIIKFVEPCRKIDEYREKCKRYASLPFNSTNKYMVTITD